MKILESETKFAHLGKPGTVFSKGFERRLNLLLSKVDLQNKIILDLGTGEGVWLSQFLRFTKPENLYASEFDSEQVEYIKKNLPSFDESLFLEEHIVNCPGENLAFENNFFNIIFQNEVLEHVKDDRKTIQECFRVLKKDGRLILFTPNRGWPFEQHGMFFRGKYYWGNIPLLPWMPNFVFKKFAPHVRNYTWKNLRNILSESGFQIEYHTRIFPGFDKLKKKYGFFGKIIAKAFYLLENSPFNFFGISHFVVARKVE